MTEPIEKLVISATDPMLFKPDWDINMQVVDMINNSTDLNLADLAITRLRDRFKLFADQDDPCILCLELLDAIAKNCYDVAKYVGRQDIVAEVLEVAKSQKLYRARDRAKELIQYYGSTEGWGADPNVFWPWAYQHLLSHGYKFPPKGVDDFKPLKREKRSKPAAQDSQNRVIAQINENSSLLREILINLDPTEDVNNNELVQELVQRARDLQDRVAQYIAEKAPSLSEDTLAGIIGANDKLTDVLEQYERMKRGERPVFKDSPKPQSQSGRRKMKPYMGEIPPPRSDTSKISTTDKSTSNTANSSSTSSSNQAVGDLLGLGDLSSPQNLQPPAQATKEPYSQPQETGTNPFLGIVIPPPPSGGQSSIPNTSFAYSPLQQMPQPPPAPTTATGPSKPGLDLDALYSLRAPQQPQYMPPTVYTAMPIQNPNVVVLNQPIGGVVQPLGGNQAPVASINPLGDVYQPTQGGMSQPPVGGVNQPYPSGTSGTYL